MKHGFKNIIASGVITAALLNPAYAGDFRLGVNVGQSSLPGLESECNSILRNEGFSALINCDSDTSDTSTGLHLRYNFTKVWGIEVGYLDFGEAELSLNSNFTSASAAVNYSVDGIYLAGTATWNMNDAWSLTGLLGVQFADLSASSPTAGISVEAESNEAGYFGLALGYQFSKSWSANARYDYANVTTESDDTATDAISLGIEYLF